MKVGSFDLQMGEREGFHLVAPDSYWRASDQELQGTTGGCGPGALGDWFVPDTMYGESVFLACQIHDFCYFKGLTLQDKRTADILFLLNMVLIVDDGELLDTLRLRRVMTYYQAVASAGKKAFLAGKEGFKEGYKPEIPANVMADLQTGIV